MNDRIASRPARTLSSAALLGATAAALLTSSCATQPFGDAKGKPIFRTFEQCMAANGVGAVVIGVVAKKVTSSNALAIAAAASTLFFAWKACGQAHQKVAVSDERNRSAIANDPRFRNATGLTLDDLQVVSTKPGDDIVTRYHFAYLNADASKKDIAAKEKFVYLAGYENGKGQIEFKEIEFSRDFVIQQGQRKHEHAVPSDASFGNFKPWKLRYSLEVEGQCVATEATFPIQGGVPGRGSPAEPCAAAQARWAAQGLTMPAAGAQAGSGAGAAPPAAAPPGPAVAPETRAPATVGATLKVAVRLQEVPRGNFLKGKAIPASTNVTVLVTQEVVKGSYKALWSRIQVPTGETGWTRDSNLKR